MVMLAVQACLSPRLLLCVKQSTKVERTFVMVDTNQSFAPTGRRLLALHARVAFAAILHTDPLKEDVL